MSISKATANANSTVSSDAIILAANTAYIATVDQQILDAIAQGEFWVNSLSYDLNIDIQTVYNHYRDLGYIVTLPDYPTNRFLNPAAEFGDFWTNYWSGDLIPRDVNKPFRMVISWA